MQPETLGAMIALAASLSWGSGDFIGGFASRRLSHYPVLFLNSVSSIFTLFLTALLLKEGIPTPINILYSITAGTFGAFGMAALLKGLAQGSSAIVAPIAGVIGVILPMLAGIVREGLPGASQSAGFFLALIGIWLVTRFNADQNRISRISIIMGLLAGIGFGGFLLLIARVKTEEIFMPLTAAKLASLITALIMLWQSKQPIPRTNVIPFALFSGIIDAGGNVFYLAATQFARLDVVAVLASLYPAVTVLWSYFIFKEMILRKQWIGIIACVLAIILISI
jgi:drug/metabolite transporter (DMT)-like permease